MAKQKILKLIFICCVAASFASPVKENMKDELATKPRVNIVDNEDGYRVVLHGATCTYDLIPKKEKSLPIGYAHIPEIGTYRYSVINATFNEARKNCNEDGAHLAIINSETEKLALISFPRREYGESASEAFIGIHDLFSDGEWVTVLGDPIGSHSYYEWHEVSRSPFWKFSIEKIEDTNANEEGHCGAIVLENPKISSGKLRRRPCDTMMPFFCEMPEIPNN